jgi:CDGSH-type Zn-finger protein/uncharacterized Fe-S cluster protein YjdI
MDQKIHEYEGEAVDVTWDQLRCIHAAECVRGLPAVFDTDRRPWIDPDEADVDAVAEVVGRCPTGALHVERHDGCPAESVPERNTVTVATDGPLYVHGDVTLVDADGDTLLRDTRVALCRCGASANKPLCDGSHADVDFEAAGRVERGGDPVEETGDLTITGSRDGPLLLDGPFELGGDEDGTGFEDSDAALCRCGASSTKPFCDGTHGSIGFTSGDE